MRIIKRTLFNKLRTIFFLVTLFSMESGYAQPASSSTSRWSIRDTFSLAGSRNIMDEDDFGIINGRLTFRVNYRDVATISGLYAPPYASSDFLMEIRFFGEKVPTLDRYTWYPNEVDRNGKIHGVTISTSTVLTATQRAGIIAITLENKTNKNKIVPVQFNIKGGVDYVSTWGFSRPDAHSATEAVSSKHAIIRENDAGSVVISTDMPDLKWFDLSSHWNTHITLAAGTSKTYYVGVAIGNKENPMKDCKQILQNPQETIRDARQTCESQLENIFAKLPRFSASNKKLEAFYNRSLVNLYMTKWEVPEFILHPYYGSGAVIGGCVMTYIWEFCIPYEIFPLYDQRATREYIKKFIEVNKTIPTRFNIMTGKEYSKGYPVSRSLIIRSIYYYVLHTGDLNFLKDTVNGETVLQYTLNLAMFGDDTSKPVALYDYGEEGERVLELRRGFPYHGIMPGLNARRYDSYLKVYKLSELVGKPITYLPQRAKELKSLLKNQLWSARDKWFYFETNRKKDIRWTELMYMMINCGVLDKEEEEGMLTHLNDREFLSAYGLHSISKIDSAYDQADIDNGGGGCYTAFPPMICERLYNSGHQVAADNILRRILWWGEQVPYWGDSFVANYIGYRDDTPLQSNFASQAGAQCIIFGMFGVSVNFNGDITVNPHTPSFSHKISLQGLKLRGCTLDIAANKTSFNVVANGKIYHSKIGKPVVISISNTSNRTQSPQDITTAKGGGPQGEINNGLLRPGKLRKEAGFDLSVKKKYKLEYGGKYA